ncbi:KDGP aldolase family protein [uncultured Traorella sp.]|uniref:2-dehydro-3-deoxy-phosphogluconate aldolase n=1 Tax=uncultured Traorella sp. TaxID=1929048 RepID=UPI0025D03620|nr:KDGP aldolase family protein [uncultured Traorella sp.]
MINYYKNKICLNVLAGDHQNAQEIYQACEKHVIIGVLSANYPDVKSAVEDMRIYNDELEGNLSVGLGGGNPNQCKSVAEISREVNANHFNQIFSAVGYTRACIGNDKAHVNALVSPSGKIGEVKISTGPLSKDMPPANVPVETAIAMIKEMGGNSLKFFPMHGLKCKEELKVVAQACAKYDFILEPTGGINLNNFREIIQIILNAGVDKMIPHVYSSIIDKKSGRTRIEDVKKLMKIIKEMI